MDIRKYIIERAAPETGDIEKDVSQILFKLFSDFEKYYAGREGATVGDMIKHAPNKFSGFKKYDDNSLVTYLLFQGKEKTYMKRKGFHLFVNATKGRWGKAITATIDEDKKTGLIMDLNLDKTIIPNEKFKEAIVYDIRYLIKHELTHVLNPWEIKTLEVYNYDPSHYNYEYLTHPTEVYAYASQIAEILKSTRREFKDRKDIENYLKDQFRSLVITPEFIDIVIDTLRKENKYSHSRSLGHLFRNLSLPAWRQTRYMIKQLKKKIRLKKKAA